MLHNSIQAMLERYKTATESQTTQALKEIMQEISLVALWRAKFFEHAAFYGGTALRILHGLDRFSEDLDFTLLSPQSFSLAKYQEALEEELRSYGFAVEFSVKPKRQHSAVQSAFLKANTLIHLIKISPESTMSVNPNALIKIKLEIDTDPPCTMPTEAKVLLEPTPVTIRVVTLPAIFAGKVVAMLCRSWKGRVKGRDWYDFVWLSRKGVPLDINFFSEALQQQKAVKVPETGEAVQKLIREKIESLDVLAAQQDAIAFAHEPSIVEQWSKDYFLSFVDKMTWTTSK